MGPAVRKISSSRGTGDDGRAQAAGELWFAVIQAGVGKAHPSGWLKVNWLHGSPGEIHLMLLDVRW